MPDRPLPNFEPRFRLRMECREDHLLAVVSGEGVTLVDVPDCTRRLIEECRQAGLSRILFVRDIVHALSLPDAFLAVSQLVDLGQEGLTVAFVDLHQGHEAVNRFCERVATSHGLAFRLFGSIAEAESWLTSSLDLGRQAPQPREASPPQLGLRR